MTFAISWRWSKTRASAFPSTDTPAVVRLTEYAVPLRYDELLDAVPLDREVAVKLVAEVGAWANTLLDTLSE